MLFVVVVVVELCLCCGVWASLVVEHEWALECTVLVAPWHVGSQFTTRDRTRIPCIGRWTLNHWTTREAPLFEADLCGLQPEVLLLSGLQLDLANVKHMQKVREQEKREGVLFIFPTHGLAVSLGWQHSLLQRPFPAAFPSGLRFPLPSPSSLQSSLLTRGYFTVLVASLSPLI